MIKILAEMWGENKEILREMLPTIKNLNKWKYRHLVRFTFDVIFNGTDDDRAYKLDTSAIKEIDDGAEKGTLLYIIPFDVPTPTEREYFMTFIGYGSCESCDALQFVQAEQDKTKRINMYMSLCEHIIANTIKPFNYGWRNDELFNEVEIKESEKGDGGVAPISSQNEKLERPQK